MSELAHLLLVSVMAVAPQGKEHLPCTASAAPFDSAALSNLRGPFRFVFRRTNAEYVLIDSADVELREASPFLATHTRSLADSTRWVEGSNRPVWGTLLTPIAPWSLRPAPPDSEHPAISITRDGQLTIASGVRGLAAIHVQLQPSRPSGFAGSWRSGGLTGILCAGGGCEPVTGTLCAYPITRAQLLTPADVHAALGTPLMNMKAFSVGAGYTAGGVGIEWVQRHGLHWSSAIGAGVAGVGGRVIWQPWVRIPNPPQWVPYVSPGFTLVPWHVAHFDGAGLMGGEVGIQRWGADGTWFADLGVGAASVVRGRWRDERVVPLLRLAIGRASPW